MLFYAYFISLTAILLSLHFTCVLTCFRQWNSPSKSQPKKVYKTQHVPSPKPKEIGKTEYPAKGVIGPDFYWDSYECGDPYTYVLHMARLDLFEHNTYIYYLNKTAEILKKKGFTITVLNIWGDAISNMSYTNGTYTNILAFKRHMAIAPAGGKPAERERSRYMAQLGRRNGKQIAFLCDGVLINRQWVLSAAHCFTNPIEPNFVRLGDYDTSQPSKRNDDPTVNGKRIEEYPIKDVFFHPEYKYGERYHDLILIQLPQKTPMYAFNINPVCLPWNSRASEDLVGQEVFLTGWGALKYGRSKTNLLQQVKLKVFDAGVCNKSYSQLPKFFEEHPQGLNNDNILCVGWKEDGKDACDGDSGAPLVSDVGDHFTAVGIVSGGYGCGLKEYPGLYIPINKPKYLNWIKEIAFQNFK